MAETSELELQEQPSEDEDTVEFEIEVVTSSASLSRASTPAADADLGPVDSDLGGGGGGGGCQGAAESERESQPAREVQDDKATRDEGWPASGGDRLSACNELDSERESEPTDKQTSDGTTSGPPGAPEAATDASGQRDVDTSAPPPATGGAVGQIPLGESLPGDTTNHAAGCTLESSHGPAGDAPAALADSSPGDLEQDLNEGRPPDPESCRQTEASVNEPDEAPEAAPVAADESDHQASSAGQTVNQVGALNGPQRSESAHTLVGPASDSGDGCEQELVDCGPQCLDADESPTDARGAVCDQPGAAQAASQGHDQQVAQSHPQLLTADRTDDPTSESVGLAEQDARPESDERVDEVGPDKAALGTEDNGRACDEEGVAAGLEQLEDVLLVLQEAPETPIIEIQTGKLECEADAGQPTWAPDACELVLPDDTDSERFQAGDADDDASAGADMPDEHPREGEDPLGCQLVRWSSSHLDISGDLLDDEDLEREFDEEPEFVRRDVQVKRNRNPRDEYELGAELGRGKFGTVVRCTERASGLQLAAKFIHMRRREDREDVEREVAIMSVLQHRRLLQLYDAFDDGLQEMCLITELVEGGELFERIVDDDFDLTEKKAAIFMRQICEGVEYMHGQQIVHLDMKPENVLCLSRTGIRIKLIDFGLARRLDPHKPIRVLFGTPDFAAPEVLGYETVTLATDMWSVGVICYVLLSGLSPFMGDTDMETMANVMRATFDFNDQAFEAISDLAKDFISKLMVREPEARLKPAECLRHAWLERGGGPLDAHIRERRKSSFGLVLESQHRLALEQAAALTSLAGPAPGTPPTPPGAHLGNAPSLLAGARSRGSFGTESTASAGHLSINKRRLKRYVVRRKWHKTVHAIMALGRMGANLKLA